MLLLLLNSDIEDLKPLIPILAQFKHLSELNLSKNKFNRLPPDLSSWTEVANMNLADIDFDDFEQAIHSLATLPNL